MEFDTNSKFKKPTINRRETTLEQNRRVSVLITTAGRPDMLRTALRSVAAQTAFHEIAEVIVSENAGDPISGRICKEFPGLPLTYRLRNPPIPHHKHLSQVLSETQAPLAALLFDDDWWSPEHLSLSIERLRDNPTASASLAASFNTRGEFDQPWSQSSDLFWLGTEMQEFWGTWILDCPKMAVASLFCTPGRYSSLVAPLELFREVNLKIERSGNLFDNDRMFFLELTRHGPVAFDPIPRVFIRVHPTAHSRSFKDVTRQHRIAQTTEWIINWCEMENIDLKEELKRRAKNFTKSPWPRVLPLIQPAAWRVLRDHKVIPTEWEWPKDSLAKRLRGFAGRLRRWFRERDSR